MECGRLFENEMMRIIVADEISPDSCRLWDIKSNEKLDKDRFRRDLGGLLEAYTEVAKRLGILMENERPRRFGPGAGEKLIGSRHPEVLAVVGEPRRMQMKYHVALRGPGFARAPQGDVLNTGPGI